MLPPKEEKAKLEKKKKREKEQVELYEFQESLVYTQWIPGQPGATQGDQWVSK